MRGATSIRVVLLPPARPPCLLISRADPCFTLLGRGSTSKLANKANVKNIVFWFCQWPPQRHSTNTGEISETVAAATAAAAIMQITVAAATATVAAATEIAMHVQPQQQEQRQVTDQRT